MSYTDLYTKKPRKIPTLLAVLVAIGIMAAAFRFVLPSQPTQATKKGLQSIEITNVFSGQVTIIWKTDQQQKGWIVYGESESDLTQVATDERDGSQQTARKYHYVTLKDLKKNTRYFFKITDGDAFLETGGRSLFTFQTIGTIDQINNLKPAYGKIIDRAGVPYQDAIVTLSAKNVYALSTLSKSTGEWLIPLNYTVDKSTGKFVSLSPSQAVRIHVYSETGKETIVTALVSQLSPVEKSLQLGQTYTFENQENVLSAQSNNKTPATIDVNYPAQNAVIPAQKPLIKGTGPAGAVISITISGGKGAISGTSTIDSNGTWKYDVPQLLQAGTYTLAVAPAGSKNKAETKNRTFTIAKSGVQVLSSATSSANLTPTQAVTPSPTIDPASLTPTVTPIIVLNSPTPQPTTIPTQVASSTPTPPVSGGSIYALVLSSVALILFGAGLMVIF